MEAHRFEPPGHDFPGYWNVTSSIDWCERNYVVSYYVAEFWNTISAAIFVICGLLDFQHALRMRAELRFKMYSLSVVMVGIGTATFHGSLTFVGQLGDELPMVWMMMILWYIMIVMETKDPKAILPVMLALYSFLFSVVHSVGAFHRVFQVHFAVLILVTLGIGLKHLLKFGNHKNDQLWPLGWYYVALWIAALGFWLSDQFMCQSMHSLRIGSLGLPNPQGHAFWHLLTGLSTHVGMVFVRVLRYMAVYGERPNIEYKLWFWPVVNDLPPKSLLPGKQDLGVDGLLGKSKSS
jgi:dihydroceramidase